MYPEIKYAYYNWPNQAEPLPDITAYCNNQLIQTYNVGTQYNNQSGLMYTESMHKEPIRRDVESAQTYNVPNNCNIEPAQAYHTQISNECIKEETNNVNQEKCNFEQKYLEKELSNHSDILVDSVHSSFTEHFENPIDSIVHPMTPYMQWEKYSNSTESFEDIIEEEDNKEPFSEDQNILNKNITHFTSSSLECSISNASIKLTESKSSKEELENSTFNLREHYNWNEQIETTNIEQSKYTTNITTEDKQVHVTKESKSCKENTNRSTENKIDTDWNQLRKKLSSICINDEDICKYESVQEEKEEPNTPISIRTMETPKCDLRRNKSSNNIRTKKNHEIKTNTEIEKKYEKTVETVETVETKIYKSIECLTSNDFPKQEITKTINKSVDTISDHQKSIEFNKPVKENYTIIISGVSKQKEPAKTRNSIQKNQTKTVSNNLKTNKYNNIHNSSRIYELERKKPENLKKLKSNPFIIKETRKNEKRYYGYPKGSSISSISSIPIMKNQKIPNLKVHVQKPLNIIITPPKVEKELSKNDSFKNNENQRKEIEIIDPEKNRMGNGNGSTISLVTDSENMKTNKTRDLFITHDPVNNTNIFQTNDPLVTNSGFVQNKVPFNKIRKPSLRNLETFSSYETSNGTLNKLTKAPLRKTADSISISNFFENNHDDFTKFILRDSKDDVISSQEDNRRSNSSLGIRRNNTMDTNENQKNQYNKKESSTMSSFFKWYKPQSEKEYANDTNKEINKDNTPFEINEKVLHKIYSNQTPIKFINKSANLYTNQPKKDLNQFSWTTPTRYDELCNINGNQNMKSKLEDSLKDKMSLDNMTNVNTSRAIIYPELLTENKMNSIENEKDTIDSYHKRESNELDKYYTEIRLPTIELNNESIRGVSSISQEGTDKIMNENCCQLLKRKICATENVGPISNMKKHEENKINEILSMRSTPLCDSPQATCMRPKSILVCNQLGTIGKSKHSTRSSSVSYCNQKQNYMKEIKPCNKIKQPYYCCKPLVRKDANMKTPRSKEKPKKELKIAKHLRNSFRKSSMLEEFSPDRYEVIESVVDRNKWKHDIQSYQRNRSKNGTYYEINNIRNRTKSKERDRTCCLNPYRMKKQHGKRNTINSSSPMVNTNAELICRVVPKASFDMKPKTPNSKTLAFIDTVRLSSRMKQKEGCMNCFQGRNKRNERVLAVTESYKNNPRRSNSVNNKMGYVKMNNMMKSNYRLAKPKQLIATNSLSNNKGTGKEKNSENCNICNMLKECNYNNTNKCVERKMSDLRVTFGNSMEQFKMKLRDIPHTLKAKQKKRNGYITTQIS